MPLFGSASVLVQPKQLALHQVSVLLSHFSYFVSTIPSPQTGTSDGDSNIAAKYTVMGFVALKSTLQFGYSAIIEENMLVPVEKLYTLSVSGNS